MGIHDKRPQELIDTVKRIKNKFDKQELSKFKKDDWSEAMDHSIHCLNREDCLKLVQAYSSMVKGEETKKEGLKEWLYDGITISVLLIPLVAVIIFYLY